MAFVEGAAVDNLNTWISGGGLVGVLTSLNWCRIKIKHQCLIIMKLEKQVGLKADKNDLVEIKKDNKDDHRLIFKKIDDLPQKIINLIQL